MPPGATKAATQLVHDFLGRDMNLEAYKRWMLAEFDGAGYDFFIRSLRRSRSFANGEPFWTSTRR